MIQLAFEPFLGEITLMPISFAPKGWAPCNGQILPINQNQALFALLGTTYGGDGRTTFALPNLNGRVAIGAGNQHYLGTSGGEESHALTINEMPSHIHAVKGTKNLANSKSPTNRVSATTEVSAYHPAADVMMHDQAVQKVGGSLPHHNMQPYLVMNYFIALQGIFPSQY